MKAREASFGFVFPDIKVRCIIHVLASTTEKCTGNSAPNTCLCSQAGDDEKQTIPFLDGGH